jgi:hypothetical protein
MEDRPGGAEAREAGVILSEPVRARIIAIWFATTFAAFAAGCYLIAVWHAELSRSVIATYTVVGITGISALAWPFFAVWLMKIALRPVLKSWLVTL